MHRIGKATIRTHGISSRRLFTEPLNSNVRLLANTTVSKGGDVKPSSSEELYKPTNRYDKILDDYFGETTLITEPPECPKRIKTWKESLRLVYSRKHPLVCVDVEAHEFSPSKITEIGISVYDPRHQQESLFPDITNIHIIIGEHMRLRNSKYCPDNKNRFMGGKSYVLSRVEAGNFISKILQTYLLENDGVLVGHSVAQDLKWIRSLKVQLPENPKTVDTMGLFLVTRKNQATLRGILRHVGLPHGYLHNAGNDAYYTLLAAIAYCDPNVRKAHNLDTFKELQKLTPGEKKAEKFLDSAKLERTTSTEMAKSFGL